MVYTFNLDPHFRNNLENQFNNICKHVPFMEQDMFNKKERTRNIPINLQETEDSFTLSAELPGVTQDNLSISFEKDVLSIEGRVYADEISKEKVSAEAETESSPVTTFKRRFQLDFPVDVDNISAKLGDGILKVVIPKSEAAKPKKIIVN